MSWSRPWAFGALVLGALLGLVATAQPWWRATGQGAQVALTGTTATAGLGQALPAVVAAGVLLALALRARGRRVLGAVLSLVGAGMVLLGLRSPAPTAETVRARLREVSLADQFALSGTAWPIGYALAGLLVVAGALLMTTQAGRWSAARQRSDRFVATPQAPPDADPAAGTAAAGRGELDPLLAWHSLDAGLDPTTEPAGDPDYQSGEQEDTMGNEQGRDQTTTHP